MASKNQLQFGTEGWFDTELGLSPEQIGKYWKKMALNANESFRMPLNNIE